MKVYDLIIIGGGSAGLVAAETAHLFRKKTALIADTRLGGDSLWYGCIPSKALLHSSRHGHSFQEVKEQIANAQKTIIKEHDNPEYFRQKGIDVFLSPAEFIDPHKVKAGNETLSAKYILISTGSHPSKPPIEGLSRTPHMTNEEIFQLTSLPKSVIVLGGGPIGCELAQAMRHQGVDVTLVQRNKRLLPKEEPAASELVYKHFVGEGIRVLTDTTTHSVKEIVKDTVEATVLHAGEAKKITAESLLVAIGRQPNIANLKLDAAGVKYTDHAVIHNKYLQTNLSHIYVAGDVAGEYQFTHWAGVQAASAVRNMFQPFKKAFLPKVVSWVTFTNPEVAHAGFSEAEITARNIEYRTITIDYSEIDRAIAEGHTEGFIKMFVGQNGLILGAQIVGTRAGELIHEIVLAMECDIHVNKLATLIHAYPTYSSGIQQAVFSALEDTAKSSLAIMRFLSEFT